MNLTRVIFLGTRPLGKVALQILQELPNVEIIATVVKEPSQKAWWKEDPFQIAEKVLKSHEEIKDLNFDLAVSVNYWRHIDESILMMPSLGFVNLHHSYNLSLRGRNMNSRAILSARSLNRWYHGTTLHYMDNSLDTGAIIASRSCEITQNDTAWTLFHKVEFLGEELLKEWLPRLSLSKVPAAYHEKDQSICLDRENENMYIKDIFHEPLISFDIVRAFDFNRYFDLAYTFINKQKIFLTTIPKSGEIPLLKIDSDRIIYSVYSI